MVVLIMATASKEAKDGVDFFPLSIDYEEKMYTIGKLPGGFIKREDRPNGKVTLTAGLINRPIRPLFPGGFRDSVQTIATVFFAEQDYPSEVMAMIGSSIALSISNIPFKGPTASVHVSYIDGNYTINPDAE